MLEHRVILRLHLDPTVLFRQVIEFADLDPGDVFETTLAIRIAADAERHFVLLPGNLAQMRDEFFPQRGDAIGGVLSKSSAKPCYQQELPMFEARFCHFDACLLIHDSTPGTKKVGSAGSIEAKPDSQHQSVCRASAAPDPTNSL